MNTLDQLRPGESARIAGVTGTDSIAMRLMEMGIFEGEPIVMLGAAPLGDPREYLVCGCQISLRKAETQRVQIQPEQL